MKIAIEPGGGKADPGSSSPVYPAGFYGSSWLLLDPPGSFWILLDP